MSIKEEKLEIQASSTRDGNVVKMVYKHTPDYHISSTLESREESEEELIQKGRKNIEEILAELNKNKPRRKVPGWSL